VLLDKTHRSWSVFSAIALIAGAVSYYFYEQHAPAGATGGSLIGLLYGIIATFMMLFAALLSGRKPLRILGLGSAQFWMRGHLWLGALSVPFVLFHAGFSWGGQLEVLLWSMLIVVIASGVFGLVMQHTMPKLMSYVVPNEAVSSPVYHCQRLTFLGDIAVSKTYGAIHVGKHTFSSLYHDLVTFYKAADKLQKQDWLNQIDPEFKDLFRNLANRAKDQQSITRIDKFPELIEQMYADLSPMETEDAATTASSDGVKKRSPLEIAREQAMAKVTAEPDDVAPKEKKSPIEIAREQAAAKTMPSVAQKKKSPIEIAREQAAAKTKNAADGDAPQKKKSPIEIAREQAAAKAKNAADGDAPQKKKSPIEIAREQAAAKTKNAADGDAPQKKKSPIEIAREQAAAKAAGQTGDAGKKPPSQPRPAKPAKPSTTRTARGTQSARPPGSKKAGNRRSKDAPMVGGAEVKKLYVDMIRPFLANRVGSPRRRRFAKTGTRSLARLRKILPEESHPTIDLLSDLSNERKQYDLQRKIQFWMHGWLIVHIPISIALMVLLIAHIVTALRVVPLGI